MKKEVGSGIDSGGRVVAGKLIVTGEEEQLAEKFSRVELCLMRRQGELGVSRRLSDKPIKIFQTKNSQLLGCLAKKEKEKELKKE